MTGCSGDAGRGGGGLRHPPPQTLVSFLGSLAEADAALLAHLLRCPPCRESILDGVRQGRRLRSAEPRDLREADSARLWRRLRGRRGEDRARLAARLGSSDALLAALRLLPAESRSAKVAELARAHPWPVAAALLDAARSPAHELAERAELARLALLAAAEIPEGQGSTETLATVHLEIRLELARIARLRLDGEQADREIVEAARFLEVALDPLAHAGFCCELARLRRDQQRADEALALFERAASLYEDHDRQQEQAEALLDKGELELYLFLPQAAAESFDLAATLVPDGRLASATVVRALRGSTSSLTALGRLEEARRLLAGAVEGLGGRLDPADALELAALQARLAADAGDLRSAESQLELAARGLLDLGEARRAAVVYAELARLHLSANRPRDVRKVAERLEPLLADAALGEPLRAVLGRFRLLLLAGTARPSNARAVAEYLDRAGDDPRRARELSSPDPPKL